MRLRLSLLRECNSLVANVYIELLTEFGSPGASLLQILNSLRSTDHTARPYYKHETPDGVLQSESSKAGTS